MNIEVWLAFVAASVVLLIIPGPTILTVISYSISHDYKAKIPLILGVTLGDSTALAFSLLGLGVLLAESAFWFQVVKWLGGLYLIYLGVKLFMAGVNPPHLTKPDARVSSRNLFVNTYVVTALNPKGIIFFVAFLPQFINSTTNPGTQIWILSSTFVALATLNATLFSVFSGKARQILSSTKAQKRFNIGGGSILTAAGIWALSAKQA